MSRYCPNHPDEVIRGDNEVCGYCLKLKVGLLDHDPEQTTAYNLDTTRKISWETLEARQAKLQEAVA